ncbi:hypothetical protein ATANTOWER_015161 [Ataeniobius toweri]|uniref:HECT domain-containing protein n=1 Tax=Ataeniobius toweri TaxID=208326 RepID=A0ABU7ARJ5_9TELE|nr:hypothetical protein [Ataeniobius toweri]
MNVKFSDDFGKNEEAIDLGGPRREFLRLLTEALSMSPMFEGTDESKNVAMNSTAIREDKYFLAGRAIAINLVHGGPAPRFLSPVLFASLVGGPNTACPTLKDVTDADLHEKLKKVSESSTLEELLRDTDPLLDLMTNTGCVRPLTTINDRDLLLRDLLMFHVVHRVQGPFESLRPKEVTEEEQKMQLFICGEIICKMQKMRKDHQRFKTSLYLQLEQMRSHQSAFLQHHPLSLSMRAVKKAPQNECSPWPTHV